MDTGVLGELQCSAPDPCTAFEGAREREFVLVSIARRTKRSPHTYITALKRGFRVPEPLVLDSEVIKAATMKYNLLKLGLSCETKLVLSSRTKKS